MFKTWTRYGWIVASIGGIFLIAFFYLAYIFIFTSYTASEELLIALFSVAFTGYVFLVKNGIDKKKELEIKKRELDRISFESRRQAYDKLLQPFIDSMLAQQINSNLDPKKLTKEMTEAGIKLAVYGSDKVVDSYSKFLELGRNPPENEYEFLIEFGKLIITIRKDTGYPDTEVDIEKVLRMFIIDYDKNIDKIKPLMN